MVCLVKSKGNKSCIFENYRNANGNGPFSRAKHDKVSFFSKSYNWIYDLFKNLILRYDYENCQADPCNTMMSELQNFVEDSSNIGKSFTSASGKTFEVSKADNFEYVDPIDKSVTKKQGIRVFFSDGSRFVMRLSGEYLIV